MQNSLMVFIFLALLSLTVFAEGDPVAGKEKSQTCAACHGVDGNSTTPMWPKLAGQHETYIVKQLIDFKSGARENAQMSPMAVPLTDQDIEDLAAYYASQEVKMGKADPAAVELGQKVYRAGNIEAGVPACMACHGPTGRGNPAAGYPSLSGQHAEYTKNQLNAFRQDVRSNDKNEVMRTIVDRMTDDEISTVAEFLQGLHFRE
ncbi:MAG TPA: c-type cytochrome [Gammaproteobacteria bacterium]|nr:c-type cytochrome [Gammaproteobacteria bacterium]